MPFTTKDLNHGAALIKIAEFPKFKAINSFEPTAGEKSHAAFSVNHDTGIYLKYATQPKKTAYNEYSFVFNQANFKELNALKAKYDSRVFLVLVCVESKEVCICTLSQLEEKRQQRMAANSGKVEQQYELLVTVQPGKSFRVYMNHPGVKKTSLKQTVVNRNDFPKLVFK